ncbi:hypothetical protein MA20_32960 [Bradyrhizobium japonicum]|uniref:Uncharacterized protein n=1 Tax=Bradyrhizobium japonicum TaxID=375 RepID=A0A0A3XPV5_BRAJP|nr:hypothetical protein [Bradyrhizobium japonicum]KGT75314.1 hypothetical protein MA20_32960 [Bradyrhizobium japonicum]
MPQRIRRVRPFREDLRDVAVFVPVPVGEFERSRRTGFLGGDGIARLLRVFNKVIEQRTIPLEQVPGLLSNLAQVNEKILSAFEAAFGRSNNWGRQNTS